MSATVHPFVQFALTKLARVFTRDLEPEELAAMADALKDLPPEEVRDACELVAQRERMWPRPVVIRDCVDLLRRQRRSAAAVHTSRVPDVVPDPETGALVQVYDCSDCRDAGFVFHRAPTRTCLCVGTCLVVSFAEAQMGAPYDHMARCQRCHKFREPVERASKSSFDDRHPKDWR